MKKMEKKRGYSVEITDKVIMSVIDELLYGNKYFGNFRFRKEVITFLLTKGIRVLNKEVKEELNYYEVKENVKEEIKEIKEDIEEEIIMVKKGIKEDIKEDIKENVKIDFKEVNYQNILRYVKGLRDLQIEEGDCVCDICRFHIDDFDCVCNKNYSLHEVNCSNISSSLNGGCEIWQE